MEKPATEPKLEETLLKKALAGAEERNRQRDINDEQLKEDLRRATEALATAQKEETANPINEENPSIDAPEPALEEEEEKKRKEETGKIHLNYVEKPDFFEKKGVRATVGALVAGLVGFGGYKTGESVGWWGNDAPKKGITQKDTPKKEASVPYVSTATNMTEEIKKVTDKPPTPTLEEIRKEIQEKFEKEKAEMRVAHSNELAEIRAAKSAPVVAPKPTPKTHEELLADIRERLTNGGRVTADEAMMHNRDLMSRPNVIQVGKTIELGGQTTAERIDNQSAPIERMKESPAGVNYIYNTSGGVNFNNQIPTQAERAQLNNPYNLSAKTLEEVEEVYERNIEKIFPNDTLKTWRSVKDKSAYEFMGKTESKIQKEYKPLFSYLEQIKKVTGLSPRSGTRGVKPESIEKYIERASQKAEKEGNLDDVKLK